MATSLNWSVRNLDYYAADGKVTAVHWRVRITDDDTGTYVDAHGSIELDGDLVVPFNDITMEAAITWAQGALGAEEVANIVAGVTERLNKELAPEKITGVPWSTKPEKPEVPAE